LGCNVQIDYSTQDGFWKYSNGFYIGDIIDKRNIFKVDKNNITYKKGNKIATIKFITEKRIEVVAPNGEKGYYVFK
jgi:hypothetical protein